MRKSELDRKAEERCRKLAEYDDFEYTVDSWSSTSKTKEKAKVTAKVRAELYWCRDVVRELTQMNTAVHAVDQEGSKLRRPPACY